jgi:Do/DeqQ family serine protease
MKARNLLGALVMAAVGAFIGIYAYTRLIDNNVGNLSNLEAAEQQYTSQQAKAMLTSFQQGGAGQVDFTYAAEQSVHAVVHVKTTTTVGSRYNPSMWEFFYGPNSRQPQNKMTGWGSGVIITPDGYIITNNHVIENAEEVKVKLNDNRELPAQIVGRDPATDIALLKIKADGLPFVKYGDSDQLKLGEWVLAVGNPFTLGSTVTAGIVSAKGRSLGLLDNNYEIESFIQTDAAVNMGNSGGALVNTNGLLVGITSAIFTPTGAYAGNSFAIPVSIVKKVVEDLREFGEVQRAIIGVIITDVTPEIASKDNLKEIRGAKITGLTEKGPAFDAGLKENDVIVGLNGIPVGSVTELREQVSKYRPGDKTNITYIRGGKSATVPITMRNIDNNTNIVKPGEGAASVVFGAKLESLGTDDYANYRIDYGVRVTEVNDGRFRDLGIKRGNIILTVNGKKVKSASDVRQFTNNGQSLTSIEGIDSNGTVFSYQFRK